MEGCSSKIKKVIVHPTVFLEMLDHKWRIPVTDGSPRVIGALIGNVKNGVADVVSSFGVPYTEKSEEGIWILDLDYADEMLEMYHKVNPKQTVVGWYQTGANIKYIDTEIHQRFQKLNPDAIMVQLVPEPKDLGIPAKAYTIEETKHEDGRPTTQAFQNLEIEIGAEEAEEVGVEHLLRDIGGVSIKSSSQSVHESVTSLEGLSSYLKDMLDYLSDVYKGYLPLNQEILEKIQSVVYDLPLLVNPDVHKAVLEQNNDNATVVLLSLLIRTVLAINQLVNNRIKTQMSDKRGDKPPKKEAEPKLVPMDTLQTDGGGMF
ncbi:26S proteasome non-ATPase regulatory subunit 7 A [Thelohanellus kitauei]|uniref:26S proteasome non-ATPase regulatory subunit 7 A n=1 Tax=Thelohanellus kitauei TaxID=669202 RepID=A0A0C2I737_THEKT|nr:26S proteasome non-ATPase regulatory subunit 7 A [Thelohanellus kitauei]